MHDNDETCFTFQRACLCPNSCATNDARQMRMTDKDTPQHLRSPEEAGLCLREHWEQIGGSRARRCGDGLAIPGGPPET